MFIVHQCLFYQVVLSAFQQTDLQERFTSVRVNKKENFSSWVQSSFSMTTSLKRKTIRRFKRQSSDGYLTQKTTQNLKIMFKMNRRFKKINMFQTLPPWQTDFDLVFKSQKTYQKILRRFLITISTSLTPISFLSQLTFIKRLV